MRFTKTILLFACTFVLCTSLHCTTDNTSQKNRHPGQLMVGGGVCNICKHRRSGQLQVEYRWDPDCYRIRPFVSFFATSLGSLYLCGGAAYDIYIGRHVVISPSFAPGLYYKGNGKELGFPLEFRSSIEMAYETKSKYRFGAQFYHISNASMGWKNPGSESLIFFVAFPLY